MLETIRASTSRIKPTIFEEFFGLGKEEKASPFLTPSSRKWASNLSVKASLLSALLLGIAYFLSFYSNMSGLSHLLLLIVYFFVGIPSLIEAIEDLTNFDINIDILMTLAAFSSVLIGSSREGALLLVLFALSGAIEDMVTAKAKHSINYLHGLSPSKATIINSEGNLIEKSIRDITTGTHILVKTGEIVPLDGKVIEGTSSVNLMHLTGESLPVRKQIGDQVPAGGRNMEGALTLEVTHTSADSTLTRIINLVTHAQEARPRLQRWFDHLSNRYAVTIISLAFLFSLTLPMLLKIPFLGIEGSVYRSLAFLIAASPCALILAIPIAYLSAISSCARNGILLKGGITLDALAQCSVIAFDKTGTLTTGNLKCTQIEVINQSSYSWTPQQALSMAYTLEKNTVHPIAKAVLDYAQQQNVASLSSKEFTLIPGYGVQSTLLLPQGEFSAFMGHPDYIRNRIPPLVQQKLDQKIDQLRQLGELVAVLLIDSALYLFSFKDTLRPDLAETIQRLKEIGKWKLLMLTGDHETSAKRIAQELDIDEFYANLKPEDKLDHVTRLAKDKGLAMIGDGINDAPALARATVGICMGKVGSGTAVDAADVVLLQDNLERLDWLMRKAKDTQSIVKQNLTIATAAIIIASFPALAGLVPLWAAVIAHEGGTVIVGLNALRLLR